MIKAGRTPVPLLKESRYVLHILPLASFSGSFRINPGAIDRKDRISLLGPVNSFKEHYNLDGVVLASGIGDKGYVKYMQLFRNGALEATGFIGSTMDERKYIPLFRFAGLRDGLITQLPTLLAMGISGPVVVALSLLSVAGYKIGHQEFTSPVDRDDLELPEVWVESIDELRGNIDAVMRPIFDMLFQCFDEQRCDFYDGDGNWILKL
ncbi:MAG: hypothetical protein ABI865_04210 [Nitrosospira sp.]